MRPRRNTDNSAVERHAAIYIRVSTDKQVKSGLGLDDQKGKTLDEAKRQGLSIHPDYIFIDEGISGKKNGDKRPSFGRMMELVKQGTIGAVIVNDLSRLGRSVKLISNAISELEKHDCAFISVKESFNTNSAMGKAMLNMIATFAQLESDLASERTQDALDMRGMKHGYKSGQVVYGYFRRANTTESKSDEVITVNTQEAIVVERIFMLRKQGLSMADIAFDISGISDSPRGKRWHASSIKVILDNEHIYRGEVAHYPRILQKEG